MDKMEMSRRHELKLKEVTGGRRTRGSGNQWDDQMDTRANHLDLEFAFAVECKSTGGQSIAVTLDMIKKAFEQAGGERPAIALRFYENDRYDVRYDLVAVKIEDFEEMVTLLNQPRIVLHPDQYEWTFAEIEEFRQQVQAKLASGDLKIQNVDPAMDRVIELRAELAESKRQVHDLQEQLAVAQMPPLSVDQAKLTELELELEARPTIEQHNQVLGQYANAEAARRTTAEQLATLQQYISAAEAESPVGLATQLGQAQQNVAYLRQLVAVQAQQLQAGSGRRNDLERSMAAPPPKGPDDNPVLPWTVIFRQTGPDGVHRLHGVRYDETGAMTEFDPGHDVRIENTIGQQQQIMVNNKRIGWGAYYSDGHLVAQVLPLAKLNTPPVNPLDQS